MTQRVTGSAGPAALSSHLHPRVPVQLALSVLCLVVVPLAMFTVQTLKEEQLSASWIMPFLPMLVLAISGSTLAEHLHPDNAGITILVSYAGITLTCLKPGKPEGVLQSPGRLCTSAAEPTALPSSLSSLLHRPCSCSLPPAHHLHS